MTGGGKISDEVASQVIEAMKDLEEIQGKKFGDLEDPLLVSVRSGAKSIHAGYDGYDP